MPKSKNLEGFNAYLFSHLAEVKNIFSTQRSRKMKEFQFQPGTCRND